MAFYYAVPQLQIGDSHYMIAISDLLLRTGSLDMRPLARADKDLPLPVNNQFIVRGERSSARFDPDLERSRGLAAR